MKKNKLLVCINLNEGSVEPLKKKLKSWDLTKWDEVHLVSCYQLVSYTELTLMGSYPTEEIRENVKSSVTDYLQEVKHEVFPKDFSSEVICKCIVNLSPKNAMVDYAKENDINLMLISTRGKNGIGSLFSSSFAEHMIRHAPCDIIVTRQDGKN